LDLVNVPRRLAAILAADVVGYTRLTGADEEGTIARLRAIRNELIDPIIAAHHGRVVKRTGDGTLVEFASVVDALRSALNVQRGMIPRNSVLPPEKRIEFRVGIHIGDVVVEDHDLLGDAVNIAARLEGIADPGGISLSEDAWRQVKDKVAVRFIDRGEQTLKNVMQPVRVFAVAPTPEAVAQSALTIPERPSIAVLPFENMSRDPEQDYFADGIVEEIITGLSRLRWLYVAARTSSFQFRGKTLDIRDIANRLGVRYILEGSVRKGGDRIRITGQLIDATRGAHLWADRYDGQLNDIFDLQDKITASVVGAIEPSVLSAEIERAARKRPESLDAYDCYLRALPCLYQSTRESSIEGVRLLDEALSLDPAFAPACALAAWNHSLRVIFKWTDAPQEESKRAIQLARKALDNSKDDPWILSMSGAVLATTGGDVETGAALVERAVQLSPYSTQVQFFSGYVLTLSGDQQKALDRMLAALRLSPSDPLAYRFLTGAGIASLLLGDFETAVGYCDEGRHRQEWGPTFRILAAAHAQLGHTAKASVALARYLELDPGATISHIRRQLPYRNAEQAGRLWEGLRKAGLPE
jgi:adenylate cyclase